MTTPTTNPPLTGDGDRERARRLTVLSWLSFLGYLAWFPLMFAYGYWVTDLVGAYPSVDPGPAIEDLGAKGWLALLSMALLLPVPNWIGALLGGRSRGMGGGRWALAGLLANLVVGLALATLMLLNP